MKDQFPIGLLRVMGYGLILAALTSILFVAPVSSAAQQEPAAASAGRRRLLVTVTDENGVAVPSARVTLVGVETQAAWKGETDYAGRREFNDLPPGLYRVQVEKEGFYAASLSDVRVGNTNSLEITLNHQQEFSEVMDVTYSPPAIDPTKTSASEGLNSQEIINIPYPSSRDVRNLLPFIPGVVQDVGGQIHVNGSSTNQTFTQLDGFNITHPASGLSEMRVSADALRSIEVLGSRYSAEYGKGSGGVLSYATGMGDDRYRFSATNFLPSLQNRKGIAFDNWTPRATFSGPLRRKKAWFFDAADAEYNVDIIEELPDGADRNHIWRIGNLAKAQVNWNPAHIFTAGLLVNRTRSDRAGISRFSPEETTRDLRRTGYLLTLKQQSYLANGMLAEIGLGMNQFRIAERPLGQMPFVLSPDGASGNFFRESESLARRYQVIASLYLPPARWHGRHEFRVGTDLNRVTYDQFSERRSITILRENGTRARRIEFGNNPGFRINNFEAGGFVQDRWALSKRSLLELGLRLDWDEVISDVSISPRLSFSHMLTEDGETKIAGGVGLYYDATNLNLITRPLDGRRVDFFYGEDGQTLARPPLETVFLVNEEELKPPRFLNWSLGVEHKLPAAIYLRAEFLQRRGRNGFTFVDLARGVFALRNDRRDRYDSLQITLRRAFRGGYTAMASYTRSRARSNAIFEFDLDNPIFSSQAGGPLPWDTPNRLISTGWLPLGRGYDLGYSLEWRDGYPFSVINDNQQLVEPPNSRRFPAFFSLNTHVEKRFVFKSYKWALRVGFNNVTNRRNPTAVNNNIASPEFLTFGGLQDRAFTGRIRFLGRR